MVTHCLMLLAWQVYDCNTAPAEGWGEITDTDFMGEDGVSSTLSLKPWFIS